jgi:hypothetical protein
LALDKLGAPFGGNVGVEHRRGVVEQLLGLSVVTGPATGPPNDPGASSPTGKEDNR